MSFCCTTSHLVPTPVSPGRAGVQVQMCLRHRDHCADVMMSWLLLTTLLLLLLPRPASSCSNLALSVPNRYSEVDPRYLRRLLSVLSHIWRPKQEAAIQWVLLHKQQTMPGMEIKSSRQNSRGCQKAVSSLSHVKDCPGSPGYLGVM